jgi:DNA-binding XRE family transcriptional regulator
MELRAQGLETAAIAARLGLSREAAGTLSRPPRARSPHAAVRCAACGREIARHPPPGRRAQGDLLCLACLAQNPGAPLSQRLLAYRAAAGLSQGELATKADLSPKIVSNIERDLARPKADTLRRLASVLGPGLLGEEGEER